MHSKALFIHRRDLRVQDNTALNAALKNSTEVLPCFIFDPKQIGKGNEYRSDKQVQFMVESLEDLEGQYAKIGGKLFLISGDPLKVIDELISKEQIDALYINADYSPYAKERDEAIKVVCEKRGVSFSSFHDLLLIGDPAVVLNLSKKPFTVFTPFWKRAMKEIRVAAPVMVKKGSFVRSIKNVSEEKLSKYIGKHNTEVYIRGGRAEARKTLKNAKSFAQYARTRNTPSISPTLLSAHHKFGTISIRETFHTFGKAIGYGHALLRQFYWRDFYTYITYHFPTTIGGSFDKKHEILFWNESLTGFEEWKSGMTGIPIVDAGMRELNATGYMHNRVRLIVGSFLTKDLHIYWWEGEKYFAQNLIDYDICVNNGNWQWVGGTGVDPVPYFRIFNPWLQAKKFDPQAEYIKKWVPELKNLSAKQIHTLDKNAVPEDTKYPKPIVDHTEEMRKVKALYKK